MKSVTFVKLTGSEIKTIVNAYNILEELENHVAHTHLEREIDNVIYTLTNIIDELEAMGNDFSTLFQEEEDTEEIWGEDEDEFL